MSDSFEVAAESAEVLDTSHLVQEIKNAIKDDELFPVLIDDFVAYFHDVDGGYARESGYHVVNLIHQVQGPESPPNKTDSTTIEAHVDGMYINFEVEHIRKFGDYPDEDFVLSLQVTGYESGPFSFNEQLTADIDKRECEYSWVEENK